MYSFPDAYAMQANESLMHVQSVKTETPAASIPPPRDEGIAETSGNAFFNLEGLHHAWECLAAVEY